MLCAIEEGSELIWGRPGNVLGHTQNTIVDVLPVTNSYSVDDRSIHAKQRLVPNQAAPHAMTPSSSSSHAHARRRGAAKIDEAALVVNTRIR